MANNDGHNPQKQKLCWGGVLSNFWEYKGVLIPKGLRITAFVILVVKIWNTSKLVGKHLLLWTCQMTLPTHSPGSSHISALKGYCVADRAPGPSASSSLASLVPDPATLLVQHFESYSYRETNCIALWAFTATWGPCKPFLHTLSSSSLLLPETFMFSIWKNFLEVKVRFFF